MSGRRWAVYGAAGLAAVETVVVIVVLFSRDSRSADLFAWLVAVKLPFCVGLARRQAGAWFAVLLWEGTGVFAAVLAPDLPGLLRLLELGLAAAVLALLVAALPEMPRMEKMELPER